MDGLVHTNGMENFWSLLKRSLHGTYIAVQQTLSAEKITVSDDASHFAGDKVAGPFTAYEPTSTA